MFYLEVTEDHLSELLHRCASGGLVEHRSLPPRLWLLPQLIVNDLPELTADDPIVVSPAPRVHLSSRAISRGDRSCKDAPKRRQA